MILYPDPRGLGIVREQHRQSAMREAQRALAGDPFAVFTQPTLMQNMETKKLQAGVVRTHLTYQGQEAKGEFEPHKFRNAEGQYASTDEAASVDWLPLESGDNYENGEEWDWQSDDQPWETSE